MYIGRDFSPQENLESEVLGLDFVNDLDFGEQLITSRWTIQVVQGVDPDPKKHLEGTSITVIPLGSTLMTATVQRVGGLWPDVTYALTALVITDRGNTKTLWSHIRGVNTDTPPTDDPPY